MPAEHASPVRQPVASRLMLVAAGLWGVAPFYALALRPSTGEPLPPQESWGSVESETAQLNDIVAAVSGFLIIAMAAAAVWSWSYSARCLRQGAQDASVLAVGTALGTALLAAVGTGKIFHSLLSASALGLLVPLESVSLAALVLTFSAQTRRTSRLPATPPVSR